MKFFKISLLFFFVKTLKISVDIVCREMSTRNVWTIRYSRKQIFAEFSQKCTADNHRTLGSFYFSLNPLLISCEGKKRLGGQREYRSVLRARSWRSGEDLSDAKVAIGRAERLLRGTTKRAALSPFLMAALFTIFFHAKPLISFCYVILV